MNGLICGETDTQLNLPIRTCAYLSVCRICLWQVSSSVQFRTRNVMHVLKTSRVSLIKCSANDVRTVVFRSALVLA